jgi:hypothetical protein
MRHVVMLVLLWMQVACNNRPGLRWVVPENFNGCVSVYFQVADGPALPTEDGWLLINVPPQGGVLRTSSRPAWGEGLRSEFWIQTKGGRVKTTPTCHSPTFSHVSEGLVELGYCFGQVTELECKAVSREIPRPKEM